MSRAALARELAAALVTWHNDTEGAEMAFAGRYCFPADFVGFQGHFPGQPVLPGILELAALRLLVEQVVGHNLRLAGVERLKFRAVVRPGDEVTVEGKVARQDEGWQVRFWWRRGDEKIADGMLTLVAEENSQDDD